MPILQQFDYVRPSTLDEAVAAVAANGKSVLLAGGTDLVDLLKSGALRTDLVVDLKGIASLKTITLNDGKLTIGSGITFSDLIGSDVINRSFPVIAECARTVASAGIRNRATMAGNICSAVACMDSGPLLTAYDASIILAGPTGTRSIPAGSFFIANRRTAIGPGEIVTGVTIPAPAMPHAGCWVKLGRYRGEDLAQVNLIVLAMGDGTFRIAFGAVGPVPIRSKKIESALNGRQITDRLLADAAALVDGEIHPITDVRASKEYRMHMARVMLQRGVRAAVARLHDSGPPYGTSVI